eukprot:3176640-Pleurochrysis_carterae.AAC.1
MRNASGRSPMLRTSCYQRVVEQMMLSCHDVQTCSRAKKYTPNHTLSAVRKFCMQRKAFLELRQHMNSTGPSAIMSKCRCQFSTAT